MIQIYEEVSLFNLEWSPPLHLPDNDMIDEDITYILLQINMSVPPESRHFCTYSIRMFTRVYILRTSYTSCQML